MKSCAKYRSLRKCQCGTAQVNWAAMLPDAQRFPERPSRRLCAPSPENTLQQYSATVLSCAEVLGRHMVAFPHVQWACSKPLRQVLRLHKCTRPGISLESAVRALPVCCRAFSGQVCIACPISPNMAARAPKRLLKHAQRDRVLLCSLR